MSPAATVDTEMSSDLQIINLVKSNDARVYAERNGGRVAICVHDFAVKYTSAFILTKEKTKEILSLFDEDPA